ncbi:MAG: signal peptidase I [Gammaproteobacteria bacterium]|nr:signal peptidase I [Gammaproteobacteria bacterium]
MTEPLIKKRHASLAVFFSLISPGLGHLYVGKWKLAMAIPFLLFLIPLFMGGSGLIFLSNGMSVVILLFAVVYLLVMASSFILARNPASHVLNVSQKWYFYILFLVVMAVLNASLVDYRGRLFGFEPFRIPAASMLPTLRVNDFLMVNTRAYKTSEPRRGDVVVFDYPRDTRIKYVKRIIAKGGDHLAYYDKILYINNQPVPRESAGTYQTDDPAEQMMLYMETLDDISYGITLNSSRPAMDAEYIIPEGYYFVMGDNRDNSNDSRYWGVVPRDYLYGKAEYIWLSLDAETGLRSDRIGVRL